MCTGSASVGDQPGPDAAVARPLRHQPVVPETRSASGRLGPLVLFALTPFIVLVLPRVAGFPADVPEGGGGARVAARGARRPHHGRVAIRPVRAVRGRGRAAGARSARSPGRGCRYAARIGRAIVRVDSRAGVLLPWPLDVSRARTTGGVRVRVPPRPDPFAGPPVPHRTVRRRVRELGDSCAPRCSARRRAGGHGWRGRPAAGCSPSPARASCGSRPASSPTRRCSRPKRRSRWPRSGWPSPRHLGVGVRRRDAVVPASVGASRRSIVGAVAVASRARLHRRRRRRPLARARPRLDPARSRSPRRSTAKGEFRMLWVGDPAVLPLEPVVLRDGTGYTLTRNGPGDVTEQWRAPPRARGRSRGGPRTRACCRRPHQPHWPHAGADGRALRRDTEQPGAEWRCRGRGTRWPCAVP